MIKKNRSIIDTVKPPPACVEAEQVVLGCILVRHKYCLAVALKVLQPSDFYDPRHVIIFQTMIELNNRNSAIDQITVYDEFLKTGVDIFASYLSGLADLVPTTANIETYVLQVKEFSKRRAMLENISAAKAALDAGADTEQIINNFSDIFSQMQNDRLNEIVNIKDVINEIYDEVKEGKKTGMLTGINRIDRVTKGLHKQNLIILASGAGKGKTSLALNLCVNILKGGYTVLLFSLEMSVSEMIKRLLAIISETDSNQSNADLVAWGAPDDLTRRLSACGLLSQFPFYINDKPQNIRTLISSAKAKAIELSREKKKLDLIVVDYLQLIDEMSDTDTREREVSAMAYGLKNLAKSLDIPVIAVAQTNRLAEKEGKRDYALYDLRESGAIEQAADGVIFINDPKEEGKMEYKIDFAKNRHGPAFFFEMNFLKVINKFIEVEEK